MPTMQCIAALRIPPCATTNVDIRPFLTTRWRATAARACKSHPLSPSPVEATRESNGFAKSGRGNFLFATSKGSRANGPLSRSIQSGSYSIGTPRISLTMSALSKARTKGLATMTSNLILAHFHSSALDFTWARPTSVRGASYLPSCTISSSARERPCRMKVMCSVSTNSAPFVLRTFPPRAGETLVVEFLGRGLFEFVEAV